MGKGRKIHRVMTEKEAADFLRTVASALEEGALESPVQDPVGSLENLRKLRISLKRDSTDAQISVKMKASRFEEAVEPESGAEPPPAGFREPAVNYKELKKTMKGAFKEIFKSLTSGALPSKEAVESFLEASERMISFPGKGEEHYREYKRLCDAFRHAYEKRDLEECRGRCDDLNRMKTECHSDHK